MDSVATNQDSKPGEKPRPIQTTIFARSSDITNPIYIIPETNGTSIKRSKRSKRLAAVRCIITTFIIMVAYKFVSEYIHYRFQRVHSGTAGTPTTVTVTEWPVSPELSVDRCGDWIQDSRVISDALRDRYLSSTTFDLPLSSEKLFLQSRGSSTGSVTIIQSPETSDSVKVHVVANYRYQTALDRVRVCAISRGDDDNGVGIFTPEWAARNYVKFEVIIYLPKSSGDSPLHITNFEADLPLFSYHIEDIAETVKFGSFSLKTTHMPIAVHSLFAENARLETSNARIEGNLTAFSSLELITTNAPVRGKVTLYYYETHGPMRFSATNNNAPIVLDFVLISTTRSGTGGQFKIACATSMKNLDLAFITAPVDSSLLLDGYTTLAPATVKLHKTYEGIFDLTSSLKRPMVLFDENVTDPAGRGRKRKIHFNSSGSSRITGSTSWSDNGAMLGSVNVETTLSQVVLKLL